MHIPELVLKALLGEMSEMLLTGQRAVPGQLLSTGFQFHFSTLDPALKNILGGGDLGSSSRKSIDRSEMS
jgi:NAD dependent epimerase/dehydratase family enzyme